MQAGNETPSKNDILCGVELHRVPPQFLRHTPQILNAQSMQQAADPAPMTSKSVQLTPKTSNKRELKAILSIPKSETSDDSEFKKFRKNKTFKKNVLKRLRQIGPDPENFDEINKYVLDKINPNDISGKWNL